MISDNPAERQLAYARSQIRIWRETGGVLLVEPRPQGVVQGEFPEASGTTIHVVTAHNPGRQLSGDENADRHARLHDRLQQQAELTVWPAEGGDAEWTHSEASFAIVGLDDADAQALGREFEQEAVFAWRARELVVLSCQDDTAVSLGWSVHYSSVET